MKSKVTFGAKSTAHYTHPLYILLTVMEIFNTILFLSSLMITITIQILFIKYKQSLLITLKKTFQMWIRYPISLTAVLNNTGIAKISMWMRNGYSLELVMASHHTLVIGDLLNAMLQNVVYKDLYMTKFWAINQCLISVIVSITFFGVSQEELLNVHADLEDGFAKSKTLPGTRSSHHFVLISCNKIAHKLTNSQ